MAHGLPSSPRAATPSAEKEKGRSAERPFPELQALSLRRRALAEITP